jgi:hypothetical protein
MRTTMLAAALAFLSMAPALAQDFTAEQRAACKGDYDKFCKGTMPGGGRVLACLNMDWSLLADCTWSVPATVPGLTWIKVVGPP